MKKNYLFPLFFIFLLSSVTFSQEMLLNGGLENWTNSTTPSDWSKAENTTQESTEKRTGDFSAKMTGGTKDLAQTITGIIPGDSYTITLWYKVESGDNTDARIWSYWRDSSNSNIDNNDADTEDAIRGPNNNYLDNNDNVWTKYETTITAPAGATQFYFELRVYSSAVVYWDDLSFMHNVDGTDPTLAIVSPSDNQEFESTVNEISIDFSVANFTLSGDNGSEMSDNTGDGYIVISLTKDGELQGTQNIFTTSETFESPDPGSSYSLTAELVDNSGNSLDPIVEASVNFSVKLPCDLTLGSIDTSCDALTSGTDTFSGSIDFTGGNTGITYTITAPQGVTVGGDDPNSIAEGTITFSGMTEGIDADITIVGGDGSSCDFTRTLYSPTCISLPIYEPFDYAADTDLIAQSNWQNASDSSDEVKVVESDGGGFLILDSYYGQNELPDFTGNMVSFSGIGSDPYIGFSDVTSGVVYASFTFHVSDMANFSNTNGGYFAVLTENSDFKSRLWLRDPNAGTQDAGFVYNLGLSTGSTATMYNDFTANLAEPVFVVIGYDLDNDETKMWVVPDASSFGTSTPPDANLTISSADAGSINRFLIRQDSSSETPSIDFDELRLGTSWADVTSNPTASVNNNSIEGFATYPNPVTNNQFTITSNSLDTKKVAIFNVIGKKVFTTSVAGTKSIIDVSSISSGLYILKVTEGNKIATSKLVIE